MKVLRKQSQSRSGEALSNAEQGELVAKAASVPPWLWIGGLAGEGETSGQPAVRHMVEGDSSLKLGGRGGIGPMCLPSTKYVGEEGPQVAREQVTGTFGAFPLVTTCRLFRVANDKLTS
ncbi:hypothetical protein MHU86_8987 [Fragilaria crotonensis]|nr:hypothetical protein MHU86_8987 [Fragilaria crotonensis]